MARDRSLEDSVMKRATLIAGMASVAAAALWSLPAAADPGMHDKWPAGLRDHTTTVPATDAPEPGTLALLALGLSGLGIAPLRRRRRKD
jgi:MYXO-CTERM domain-containing protein